MKAVSQNYKNAIKTMGRQIDAKITYTIDDEDIELSSDMLNSISSHYQGSILKSVMKQLDIDCNVNIPIGTILKCDFGVFVNNAYEYISFGNFIVYSSEKQEDTKSYKLVCYDKMLYSMKDYEDLEITYPISVRNYIDALCTHLDLTFANSSDTFVNYDREIPNELFLDAQGNSLDYTFRDVLDQLAEITASTICINEDDELEIRYITNTNEIIDEEYLKDVNVNFGEQYGPINTITFKRSADSDAISRSIPSNLPDDEKIEIAISDNQFLNDENRGDYIDAILNQLYGLTYYMNDYVSTGITYLDLCDKYNIQITDENTNQLTTYSCIMFNDETNITQGLVENIHTEMPDESKTDYNTTTKDDRIANRTNLVVDKINHEIRAIVENSEQVDIIVNGKTDYELTTDTTYQNNKTYYVKSGNDYITFNQYSTYEDERIGNPYELGLFEALYSYAYILTEDTEFEENDDYYEKVEDDYVLYTGPRTGNPSELGLYDRVSNIIGYQATTDTSFVQDKTYFIQNYVIGDTIPSNTIYDAIRTPSVSEQINSLDASVDSKLEGFTGTINNITNSVETLTTTTYTKTQVNQIVNGTGVDGVVVSATISEVGQFDKDGLLIQKTTMVGSQESIISESTGRFNEKGVQVKETNFTTDQQGNKIGTEGNEVLYAGYVDNDRFNVGSRHYQGKTIVYTQNLQAGGETIIGSNCLLKDYEGGTGWFVL